MPRVKHVANKLVSDIVIDYPTENGYWTVKQEKRATLRFVPAPSPPSVPSIAAPCTTAVSKKAVIPQFESGSKEKTSFSSTKKDADLVGPTIRVRKLVENDQFASEHPILCPDNQLRKPVYTFVHETISPFGERVLSKTTHRIVVLQRDQLPRKFQRESVEFDPSLIVTQSLPKYPAVPPKRYENPKLSVRPEAVACPLAAMTSTETTLYNREQQLRRKLPKRVEGIEQTLHSRRLANLKTELQKLVEIYPQIFSRSPVTKLKTTQQQVLKVKAAEKVAVPCRSSAPVRDSPDISSSGVDPTTVVASRKRKLLADSPPT